MYMTQKTNWFKAEDEKLMKQIRDKVMKGQTTDWDKIDEIFLKEKKELRRLERIKARKEAGVERFHKRK